MVEAGTLVQNWFKALLTLVALALATNILVGPSLRWKPVFLSGTLTAVIACEYYYIFFAVMKLPRDWVDRTGVEMQRLDCRRSTKGGKIGEGSENPFGINPCFCPTDGLCKDLVRSEWILPTECPTDGTGRCFDVNLDLVSLYGEIDRDCTAAQGTLCTKDEPCTPCDLDSIMKFRDANVDGVSRCQRCGPGNTGACNFVDDEGPYCKKSPWSTQVEPCTLCCTEPEVLTVNGTCY